MVKEKFAVVLLHQMKAFMVANNGQMPRRLFLTCEDGIKLFSVGSGLPAKIRIQVFESGATAYPNFFGVPIEYGAAATGFE